MGNRNKLMRFAEIREMDIVFENSSYENPQLTGKNGKPVNMKGKWATDGFGNQNDLVLELACGRGEYAISMAKENQDVNYMGVDIKGARIWKGAKYVLENKITNVRFLRTRIEMIDCFFESKEVSEIWITFADPFHGKDNRKLTSPSFLNRYKKFLKDEGKINLKTDDDELYEFTLEIIESYASAKLIYESNDIYSSELYIPELNHKTYYESMHLEKGKTIKFVSFTI